MEASTAISIIGTITIVFIIIIAFFDICDRKKENVKEQNTEEQNTEEQNTEEQNTEEQNTEEQNSDDKKSQEQKVTKSETIFSKKKQPSLRQVIKLVKDFENGGRELSRRHEKIKENKIQDFDIALAEGQIALNVIRYRSNKKFRKDMDAINLKYGR